MRARRTASATRENRRISLSRFLCDLCRLVHLQRNVRVPLSGVRRADPLFLIYTAWSPLFASLFRVFFMEKGAVKASRLPIDMIDKEPACLGHLLKSLKKGQDENRLNQVHDRRAWWAQSRFCG